MIQRFEVTTTGMSICGTWDTVREHYFPIAWLFLAYKVVYMIVVGSCGGVYFLVP